MSKLSPDLDNLGVHVLKPGECVRVFMAGAPPSPDGVRVLSWLGLITHVDLVGVRFVAAACQTDSGRGPIRDETPHVVPWIRIADIAVIEPGVLDQEIARRHVQRVQVNAA